MDLIKSGRPPVGVQERRKFGRRVAVSHPIEVAGKSGGFHAQTVNVSRTGVLVWICDEAFLPNSEAENMLLFTERVADQLGEGFEIRFSGDIAIEAEVIRLTRRDEKDSGAVLLACRYARPLNTDEWVRLNFEGPTTDGRDSEMEAVLGIDRRAAPRHDFRQPVEIHSEFAAYRAEVINVSAMGVLLEMTDPAFAPHAGSDRLLVCTRRLGTQFGRGMRVRFLETDVTVAAEIVRVGESRDATHAAIMVACKFEPPLDSKTCDRIGIEPLFEAEDVADETAEETGVLDLMRRAMEMGATDLHLKACAPPRVRCAGILTELHEDAISAARIAAMAGEIMGRERADQFDADGPLVFVHAMDGLGRFRVNVMHQRSGMAMAIRCLPETPPSVEALGMEDAATTVRMLDSGLVLIAGIAGSGRSTSLAAIVREVNQSRANHLLVLQEHAEFVHDDVMAHVTQRDLDREGVSMAVALNQTRHMDADVLAVGHVRDAETVRELLDAAESGRLVIAVMNAATSAHAVSRILAWLPERQQEDARSRLANVLAAILVQSSFVGDEGTTQYQLVSQIGAIDRIPVADAQTCESLPTGTRPSA